MGDLSTAALGAGDGNQSESQTSQATQAAGDGSVGDSSEAQAPAWTAQLPDDLKSNDRLTQFTKLGDLGRAYLDSEGRLAKSIEVPGEGATEEQVAEFKKKLGVPDSPKDYALKDVEDLPDVPKELLSDAPDWFQEMSHKTGLTKDQAATLYKEFLSRVASQIEGSKTQRNEAAKAAEKVLQQEWGEKYKAKMSRAKKIVSDLGGEEFANYLNETGQANDPRMIRFMARLAEAFGDDTVPGGETVGATPKRADRLRDAANFEFPNSSKYWKQ